MLATLYDAELRLFHVRSTAHGCRSGCGESHRIAFCAFAKGYRNAFGSARLWPTEIPVMKSAQHARLMGSDFIVLGSDLRSTPSEFLKTVPATIVTHAPCPVLIVRPALDAVAGRPQSWVC